MAHPLYAEGLRLGIPPLRRRSIYRALAGALASTGARRKDDLLRLTLWQLEAGVARDGARLSAAARQALAMFDHVLAERLARSAERVAPDVQLDLAQAAPAYPTAPEVAEHVARVALAVDGATYSDVPGLPKLREAVAAELTNSYAGRVEPRDVVVTAGCNQAFCLVVSALAGPGGRCAPAAAVLLRPRHVAESQPDPAGVRRTGSGRFGVRR
ncbi:aminotransferase class I/II-fold pyridoxal phosphate-dependent enzyme [Actinomycetes bacterium KLBMP 9759]